MKVLTQTGLTELIAKTKEADATKVNIAQGSSASSQIMVTDASGNITPSGTTGEYFDTTLPIWDAEQVKYDDGTVTDELERLEEDKADVTAIPAEVISALADLPISTTNALKVDVPDNGVIKTGGTVKPVNDADYQKIQSSATANDFAIFDSNGQVVDSGLDESDFIVADAQALPKIVNSGVVATSTQITELTENKITVLSSSSTDTEYPSAKCVYDELATKQAEITTTNKLSADLVDDTSTTNKFVTSEEKSIWNAKQVIQYDDITSAPTVGGKIIQYTGPSVTTSSAIYEHAQFYEYDADNAEWKKLSYSAQVDSLPSSAEDGTIVQYVGGMPTSYTPGHFYKYSADDNKWYDIIPSQTDFMPSSAKIGTIIQWSGATTSSYVNGYFYKYNGTAWEQLNVQPAGGGATLYRHAIRIDMVDGYYNVFIISRIATRVTDRITYDSVTGDTNRVSKTYEVLYVESEDKDYIPLTPPALSLSTSGVELLHVPCQVIEWETEDSRITIVNDYLGGNITSYSDTVTQL